jgi:hypothetical protein
VGGGTSAAGEDTGESTSSDLRRVPVGVAGSGQRRSDKDVEAADDSALQREAVCKACCEPLRHL